jgi:RNA polymerase sigma factor (sigma-70 family)
MTRPDVQTAELSDEAFAGQLCDGDTSAVVAFTKRFAILLTNAWTEFKSMVSGCRMSQADLDSHLSKTAGRGYVRYCVRQDLDNNFTEYLSGLELTGLAVTGACIARDEATIQHLDDTVQQRIVPTLLNLWRSGTLRGVSRTTVEDIGSMLAGHLWMQTRSGETRLASYMGRCRLTSWLTGIARNAIVDEARKQTKFVNFASTDESEQPDLVQTVPAPDVNHSQLEHQELVDKYRKPILDALLSIESTLTTRQKAVFHGRFLAGIPANELADCLKISRPRISQLTAAIQLQIESAVRKQVDLLADDLGISSQTVLSCLQDLQAFLGSCTDGPEDESLESSTHGPLNDLIRKYRDRGSN